MAVTIDVGNPTDIHPRDKKTVGARLALAARALAYGETIPYSGPLFRQATPGGPRHCASTSTTRWASRPAAGPVVGFEIAGADGRYVPAEARIDGTTVVVSSPEVAGAAIGALRLGRQPEGQPRTTRPDSRRRRSAPPSR